MVGFSIDYLFSNPYDQLDNYSGVQLIIYISYIHLSNYKAIHLSIDQLDNYSGVQLINYISYIHLYNYKTIHLLFFSYIHYSTIQGLLTGIESTQLLL